MKIADLPNRKPNRLKEYDYNTPGAYFITICTKDRKNYFWDNVGANSVRPKEMHLTKYGEIAKNSINDIPKYYPGISVDKYVIMPNHIHLLLQIHSNNNGRTMFAPTIDRVIKQTKGYITKQIGFSVWQKSYYDHIVRNEQDYKEIWEYIDNNPLKWEIDRFYNPILNSNLSEQKKEGKL